MTRPVIFISYNHKDEKEKEALLTHLGGLQRAGLIEAWSDDRIGAGADWEQIIDEAMAQAKVSILLITANFLNSEFITEKEVPTLLARWEKEELRVIPVIAKACAWENIGWLQKMNVRPKDGKPVWREGGRYADEELKRIALEVALIVDKGKLDRDRPQAKSEGIRSHPTAITPNKIHLTSEEKAVLLRMFSSFGKIVIKSEFGHGLSGGRVFQVRPFEVDGRHNLPVVVKIAPVGLIRQEWQAYEAWVKNKLPNIAGIESVSKLPPSGTAGLRYVLAGGGTFEVQSLQDYYRQASTDDLRWVLQERLFKIMGQNWWELNRPEVELDMRSEYDGLLPVNLLITVTGSHDDAIHLEPDSLPPPEIGRGNRVHLQGFVVTEVDPDPPEVTLNVPSSRNDLPLTSYRLRLQHVPDIDRYRWCDEVGSVYGVVAETRSQLLVKHARKAMEGTINLSATRLALSGDLSLPNPLLAYQNLLDNFRPVRISTIHGDFNLENILVDPQTRDVSLIDFATVREGHALHDLLRLETEIVTKLIPETLVEAELPPETICSFYQQLDSAAFQFKPGSDPSLAARRLKKPFDLLVTIREEAKKYLRNRNDPAEYYQGLVLYLLGALKFKNLDNMPAAPPPLPKQVAFWGAATLVDLLNRPGGQDENTPAREVRSSLKGSREPATPTTNDPHEVSQEVRRNVMTSKSESHSGVTIGNITGGIHGSIIASGDVKDTTITIGGPPTPTGKEPNVTELKQLLTEIRRELAEISAQQDVLKMVSPAASFTTQGAAQSIKEAAATVKPELKPEAAKSVQQSLNEATALLRRILEGAKTMAEREGEDARVVKSIAEELEPLVEKIGVAASWVATLWLRG